MLIRRTEVWLLDCRSQRILEILLFFFCFLIKNTFTSSTRFIRIFTLLELFVIATSGERARRVSGGSV
jgi:hypothetical protein